MKKNEFLSVFHALQSGKNRTSLAVVVGVLVLLFLCVCSLAGAAYNPFIYFRF